MKKSLIFFILILFLSLSLITVYLVGLNSAVNKPLTELSQISRRYGLTGLCLSTESRHTRHLLFSGEIAAFQDIPGWLDHSPSSTFIFPPQRFFTKQETDR